MARDAPQHTLTVYFKENAFTANVDGLPQNPGEFFSAEFTQELLDEQMAPGRISETNLPLYVASVTYGRILMFSVTSEEDTTTIKAPMNGVAKWGAGSVSAEAKAGYERVVAGNTSDIVTVGGSSAAASPAIASGDFTEYFKEATILTEYTPISYVLRDVKDNISYPGETKEYVVQTCHRVPNRQYELSLDFLHVIGDCENSQTDLPGGEFYGKFTIGPEDDTTPTVVADFSRTVAIVGEDIEINSVPIPLDTRALESEEQWELAGRLAERFYNSGVFKWWWHVGDFQIRIDPIGENLFEEVLACPLDDHHCQTELT